MSRSRSLFLVVVLALVGCGPAARSSRSFEQWQRRAANRTGAELTALLGEPDAKESLGPDEVRWIWRRYTYLDGDLFSSEVRGKVVDLEISLSAPPSGRGGLPPESAWRVSGPVGVSYALSE